MAPTWPQFRALLCKEWRENAKRVRLMAAIAISAALLTPLSFNDDDWTVVLSIVGYGVLGITAIYFGLRVAAGERGQRTEALLCGLPVDRRLPVAAKLMVGVAGFLLVVLAAVVPAVLTGAILDRPAWDTDFLQSPVGLGVGLLAVAIPIFLWTTVVGIGAASESWAFMRVVVVGLAMAVLIVIGGSFVQDYRSNGGSIWPFAALFGLSPFGAIASLNMVPVKTAEEIGLLIACTAGAVVSLTTLTAWCLWRLHRPHRPARVAGKAGAQRQTLRRPLRSKTHAILASNWVLPSRASAIILVLILIPLLVRWCTRGPFGFGMTGTVWPEFTSFWIAAGLVHAALLAALLPGRELENGLPWFWRSQPIAVGRWYLTRAVTGTLILLAVYATPLILDLIINLSLFSGETMGYTDPSGAAHTHPRPTTVVGEIAWSLLRSDPLWVIPLAPPTCYAVVLLLTAWLRKPVMAAVIGFCLTGAIFVLPDAGNQWAWLPRWNPFQLANSGGPLNNGYPWFLGICFLLTTASLLLATRSFRRRVV